MALVKVAADEYATEWEGPLGVVLLERDVAITDAERDSGQWSSSHVAASYAIAVRDRDGNEWVIRDRARFFYNPEYVPADDQGLARDILECFGLDFGYDNEYWPDTDDPDDVAACILRYVRDMGADIPETEGGLKAMISGFREPGRIYRDAVTLCGDESALTAACERLRDAVA